VILRSIHWLVVERPAIAARAANRARVGKADIAIIRTPLQLPNRPLALQPNPDVAIR